MKIIQQPTVIIPCFGSLKNKFVSYQFHISNASFVPVLSKSSISLILEFYQNLSKEVYLIIDKEDLEIFKNELSYFKWVNYITISNSNGIIDTIYQGLKKIKDEDIVVNIPSSIPSDFVSKNECYIDTKLFKHSYYSGINFTDTGILFKSKYTEDETETFGLQGIFRCEKKIILDAVENCERKDDLVYLIKEISNNIILEFVQKIWNDTGHEINYASTRKKIVSSRSFNTVSIDETSNILIKKSTDTNKLMLEASYMQSLPKDLINYFPRIFEADRSSSSISMEYYGYPNLSEYQLYRKIENFHWSNIFARLRTYLELNIGHRHNFNKKDYLDFYVKKTTSRLNQFSEQIQNDTLMKSKLLFVNDHKILNFEFIKPRVEEIVKKNYEHNAFSIMHGDLCFNNILYDIFSETIKFIDPRGSFGNKQIGIYGDYRYDIAKLLHSSIGNYDYIVNNLYNFDYDKNRFEYKFNLRSNNEILIEESKKLVSHFNLNHQFICTLVGLLFVSMCPLHQGDKNKQTLMYVHGLYYLNNALENENMFRS